MDANLRRLSKRTLSPAPDSMLGGIGLLQRKCGCGNHIMSGSCDNCAKKKGSLQRKSSSGFESAAVPSIVHEVLRSTGQPLDAATRGFMEPRFGQDFSHVRVHTDEKAADSARAVDSLAYTVGRDIVFAAGQYRPATAEGRRLVGHELTHIVQQGRSGTTNLSSARLEIDNPRDAAEQEAESVANRLTDTQSIRPGISAAGSLQAAPAGVIQRTPAPPTYGGVTGVRDLTRIRIDMVPDFVASSLAAPRVVNAHINDPAVVHLSWEFYNPSDKLMSGSFSTLPGHATSTTASFSLQPSHFSGTGFLAGRYVLRCVGRNAHHQPIVYADRDFNVLSADMTTGTALATTHGDLTFTRYDKTDANPPARPNYQVNATIAFLPKSTVACSDVALMQAEQSIDAQGRSQQNIVGPEVAARQTSAAWSIDHLTGAPSPFYIAWRNSAGQRIDAPGFGAKGSGGASPSPATVIDTPAGGAGETARFEVCAICRSGANRGQTYGCATWGYAVDNAGHVTLMPRGFRQMPSDDFEEARTAWNTWRLSVPAVRRPDEAPALTSP